MIDQYFWAK